MKQFTINRKKWLRGEGSEYSSLLRTEDGKMCCLGFLGLACGGTKKQIESCDSPAGTYGPKWPSALLHPDTGLDSTTCEELMKVNDNEDLTDTERESRLKKIFKEIGIKVVFK